MVIGVSAVPRVVVDERERASGVPELLKTFGLQVERRMLDVGDYVVSPDCAVERKEVRDFVQSLYSGRLFDQAYRLSEEYGQPVLVVEGDPSALLGEMAKPRAFWGALTTLAFNYGLHVFFTVDARQTAELVFALARRRVGLAPRGPFVRKRLGGKKRDLGQLQLLLVSGLPGIGVKLANRLLERFGSLRRVFGSSVAELSSVSGVGRGKAEKIGAFLDAAYCPNERMLRQLRLDRANSE